MVYLTVIRSEERDHGRPSYGFLRPRCYHRQRLNFEMASPGCFTNFSLMNKLMSHTHEGFELTKLEPEGD